jgi:signal transduction histidine kinase
MSRELRTPLNNIVDYAGLMQEECPETVTGRQRKHLKRILEDSVRVRSMVERILELCSVDIGMSSFSPERFDLQSTLRKILDTVSESARKKEIAVRINYEEEAGFITADVKKFSLSWRSLQCLKFLQRITDNGLRPEVMLADEMPGVFWKYPLRIRDPEYAGKI